MNFPVVNFKMYHIYVYRVLEGGFASAAVLISLGAVLGKLNPFQILIMSLIEAPMFVLNSYLGYTIFGVADIGKIFKPSQGYRIPCKWGKEKEL